MSGVFVFDSLASRFQSKDREDELKGGKGAFGIALPMALASTASLGIGANEMVDSVLQFVTKGGFSGVNFEAEALNDVSHLISDLLTIVAPALPCLPLRAAAILGRLLSLAADYVPDHTVLPDEMIFQVIMLTFSWAALVQTMRPKLVAAMTLPKTLGVRDGKAYARLFQPTGMSWAQFKNLSANAMDWIDVEPHHEIPPTSGSSEYMYWLYSGSMDVKNSEGKELYTHTSSVGANRQTNQNAFMGLFGEAALLKCLEKTPVSKASSSSKPSFPGTVGETQAKAGANGATFLRIHTSQLKSLTDHDEDLASSMRKLLFHGLSSKLATQFAN